MAVERFIRSVTTPGSVHDAPMFENGESGCSEEGWRAVYVRALPTLYP